MSQGLEEQYDKTEEEEEEQQQQQLKMQFPLFSQQRNKGQVMMRNGT